LSLPKRPISGSWGMRSCRLQRVRESRAGRDIPIKIMIVVSQGLDEIEKQDVPTVIIMNVWPGAVQE
jgi:hypothetical protein